MSKPNRVHKATGYLAKLDLKTNRYFLLNGHGEITEGSRGIPAEIVEGEGWEDQKTEWEKLLHGIHALYDREGKPDTRLEVEISALVNKYIKNYNQPQS